MLPFKAFSFNDLHLSNYLNDNSKGNEREIMCVGVSFILSTENNARNGFMLNGIYPLSRVCNEVLEREKA